MTRLLCVGVREHHLTLCVGVREHYLALRIRVRQKSLTLRVRVGDQYLATVVSPRDASRAVAPDHGTSRQGDITRRDLGDTMEPGCVNPAALRPGQSRRCDQKGRYQEGSDDSISMNHGNHLLRGVRIDLRVRVVSCMRCAAEKKPATSLGAHGGRTTSIVRVRYRAT